MIKLNEISKIFKSGENDFFALKNISVTIPENKITVISGPSGSGKSTLLSIIGLLQAPSSGDVIINGEQVLFNNSVFLRDYISKNISYVFQEFNLVDDFSVVENISLVCDDLNIIDDI
ncbi:MAG: ATP-binding cassette domain-containing protein, partial [Bacilli bacterium]